jgi:lysophospholipase L1-like esterase
MTRQQEVRLAFVVLAAIVLFGTPSPAQTSPPPQQGLAVAPQVAATVPSCAELATALNAVVRNDARLRDWANLARYRDANTAAGVPAAGESRVVFMGDSITDFWQQPRFGGFFQQGKPYIDRAISGQTTPQMLLRFRRDVIALAPKAVVILAGINDIAGNTGPMTDEDIEGYLSSMAELATAHGIKVVLASIMPVSEYHVAAGGVPQTTTRPMARVKAVNAWIKKYASEHGHTYLDYFSAMVDDKGLLRADLSEDDLHPNVKGYALMAPLAEAAIAQALSRR